MDVTRWLRFIIGKENAREFYTAKEIMDPTTFNRVNWHDLRDTLALKPKIFQLWFGKQGLGFCIMGEMLRRWDKTATHTVQTVGYGKKMPHI